MNHLPVDILHVDQPRSRFDAVIECLLIALLAFMPLAFGAVEAWSEMVVICLACAIALCFALKMVVRRDVRLRWSWTYLPVALLLGLAVVQLLPLPAWLVSVVSPNTVSQKSALLADVPAGVSSGDSMTISFYPNATEHDLRLLLAVGAVFFVVANVYRRGDQIKRLLGAIALIGGGVAVLAIFQIALGTHKIYGLVWPGDNAAMCGTFVNHNNFSQFMNLSIAAALGLLLVKLQEDFRDIRGAVADVTERLTGPKGRIIWAMAAIIVLASAAVFLSLSRGGIISLLAAGIVTGIIIASKRALSGRGWIMAIVALAAFACVLYMGFDAVYDRLSEIQQAGSYENRLQIVRDIALAWTRFPIVGTGLGTHQVVYPMFDSSSIVALAGHAENEYVQAAEEAGLVGLVGLLAFIAIVYRQYARSIRRLDLPIRSAAFGLGFGLLAVMIHSLSDFGQHVPANACLAAVFCGLLVSLGQMGRPQPRPVAHPTASAWRRRGLCALAMVAVIAAGSWSLIGADRARRGEAAWKGALAVESRLVRQDWMGSNQQYADLIRHASAAVQCEPDNVEYRYWLGAYRWRAISRVRDEQTGEVILTDAMFGFAERIVDELNQARAICPTFGPTYCLAGQLEHFVLERPIGQEHIQKAFELAPCDPQVCFVAGLLKVRQGDIAGSREMFARALRLDGCLFNEIARVYIQAGRADVALDLAGDSAGHLLYLVRTLTRLEAPAELDNATCAKAFEALKERCHGNTEAWILAAVADICRQRGQAAAAAQLYRRALEQDYGQVHWRLTLAEALADSGQIDLAIHEARICLRLRPQMEAAKALIAELCVKGPQAVADNR